MKIAKLKPLSKMDVFILFGFLLGGLFLHRSPVLSYIHEVGHVIFGLGGKVVTYDLAVVNVAGPICAGGGEAFLIAVCAVLFWLITRFSPIGWMFFFPIFLSFTQAQDLHDMLYTGAYQSFLILATPFVIIAPVIAVLRIYQYIKAHRDHKAEVLQYWIKPPVTK